MGTAVDERTLRTWLTARSTDESARTPLVELMRIRSPDHFVRRKAERQLDDIADAVAARVLKLCGHEFPGLGDDDRLVVLAEVRDTLARADLSDRALLAADADPVRLARAIRATLPAPKDLGEARSRLYEVVLDECCDCLVRVVRHLPEFQPRAATEMLGRLSGLGEQLSAMLERLPVRTLEAPDGTDRDTEFRRRYLAHVSETLDNLEILGVRVERFRPRTSACPSPPPARGPPTTPGTTSLTSRRRCGWRARSARAAGCCSAARRGVARARCCAGWRSRRRAAGSRAS
ncbi:hypothetical protein ACIBP6_15375 [Nonomuraea terrae]|uniref:NACHT N-terminal Helical domain 1-containing protein n=1 Tax=Nonomuraea terrae TaxID=2530383 RepID=UPI0037A00CBB